MTCHLRKGSAVMDYHGLPTPRSTLRAGYLDVLVWAGYQQELADLQAIIESGRGDTPLIISSTAADGAAADRLGGHLALQRQAGMKPGQ